MSQEGGRYEVECEDCEATYRTDDERGDGFSWAIHHTFVCPNKGEDKRASLREELALLVYIGERELAMFHGEEVENGGEVAESEDGATAD